MARLQSGGFSLRREWMALDELIGSTLRQLAPLLEARQIALDLPPDLLLIDVDGPLMERVLINLLENALKYAGDKAEIGIRAHAVAQQLELEVWDSGPGIAPGQQQLIFEKFSRGDKESTVPGVGLGLAICQAVITLHEGTIHAENR
ncbi:ATP-binding protein, partial [Pantoea ananatis]